MHLRNRTSPRIVVSDERQALLDTGGGVAKALPRLGDAPFLVHNSDSVWIEHGPSSLASLGDAFDEARMDGLLLLADRATCLGYAGRGDFDLAADGRLERVAKGGTAPYVFAGASIATRRLMREAPAGPFSLNRFWDRALGEGRLFGIVLDGIWMHVGDSAALEAAETRLRQARTSGEGRI